MHKKTLSIEYSANQSQAFHTYSSFSLGIFDKADFGIVVKLLCSKFLKMKKKLSWVVLKFSFSAVQTPVFQLRLRWFTTGDKVQPDIVPLNFVPRVSSKRNTTTNNARNDENFIEPNKLTLLQIIKYKV